MTAKQQRFVYEYLIDLNASQAAIRAGYSPKYAGQNTDKLLKNTNVAAAIQKRRAVLFERLEVTQERVLQELAAIGFANATDFVTVETEKADRLCIHPITGEVVTLPIGWQQHVRVIDTAEVPVDKRAAIASIKQSKSGTEVKLFDKVRALEMLGRHLGLFESREAAQDAESNLFDKMVEIMQADIEMDDLPEIERS